MPKTTSTADQPPIIIPNTTWEVTLPWAEVKPVYDRTLRTLAKQVKADGFRVGKVPPHIAAPMIGPEALAERVVQNLIPARYQADVEKHQRKPLTRPSIAITQADVSKDWKVEISIAEQPVLEVKNYPKVVKQAKAEAEKKWQEHLKEHEKEAKAEKTKKADKSTNHPSHQHSEEDKQQAILQEVYRSLILEYRPQIPELLLKEQTQSELEYLVRQLQGMKMTLDDYLQRRQITFEQLSNDLAMEVIGKIQLDWLMEAINNQAKLEITDKDREPYLNRIEDKAQRDRLAKDSQYLTYIDRVIMREKVAEHLLALK